jgi:hypothetical protein
MMERLTAQDVQSAWFNALFPDEASWESRKMEFGLHREAFSISKVKGGHVTIKFWASDRIEALRTIEKLDDFRA